MMGSLHVIHGNVGIVEQFLEGEVLARGATHHADAHGKLNAVGASAVGTRNTILKPLAKMVVSLHHGSEDHKLISADAGHDVDFAKRFAKHLRGPRQQPVAGLVPQPVIDGFESVHIGK